MIRVLLLKISTIYECIDLNSTSNFNIKMRILKINLIIYDLREKMQLREFMCPTLFGMSRFLNFYSHGRNR